jgi:hypothetical protein
MPKRGMQRQRGRLTVDGMRTAGRSSQYDANMTSAQAAGELAREMLGYRIVRGYLGVSIRCFMPGSMT